MSSTRKKTFTDLGLTHFGMQIGFFDGTVEYTANGRFKIGTINLLTHDGRELDFDHRFPLWHMLAPTLKAWLEKHYDRELDGNERSFKDLGHGTYGHRP